MFSDQDLKKLIVPLFLEQLLAALVGVVMGPVFITVIGQCMGAGDLNRSGPDP